MKCVLAICLSLWAGWVLAACGEQETPRFDEKFLLGVMKYGDEDWSEAFLYISQAMDGYKQLEEARLDCFKSCGEGHTSASPRPQFFLEVLQMATCIKRCEESHVGMTPWGGVSHEILDKMRSRNGYNYLQMCLAKEGKMKEASRAGMSYNYFNPHHTHYERDYLFYESQEEVSEEDLVSLETRDLFNEGHGLFYARDWKKMVDTFEESLGYFYTALDNCKALCDGSLRYDTSKTLDFSQMLSKIYLERLDCRVKCVEELGGFRENQEEDFFGSYFQFLQQGYYNLNQSLHALQSHAAYVQLVPTNETAQRNSVFYLNQPGVTRKEFTPRKDVALEVMKREVDVNSLAVFGDLSGHVRPENWAELQQESDEEGVDEILLEKDFQQYPVGLML